MPYILTRDNISYNLDRAKEMARKIDEASPEFTAIMEEAQESRQHHWDTRRVTSNGSIEGSNTPVGKVVARIPINHWFWDREKYDLDKDPKGLQKYLDEHPGFYLYNKARRQS